MVRVANAAAVAHQAPGRGEFGILIDRWNPVPESQCAELVGTAGEECIGTDYESACLQLNQSCEDPLKVEFGARMQDMDIKP